MRRFCSLTILASAAALALAACALPGGDDASPEGAYYTWIHARQAGDLDGCWAATHPELKGLLSRWHEAEQDTLFIVESIYPSARRTASIEVLEEGGRARLPDPKALFAHLLASDPDQALAGLQLVGARVLSTILQEDTAVVITLGGDAVTVERDAERWAVTLPVGQMEALHAIVAKAESNRDRARSNVKRLRGVDQPEQPSSPAGQ